jgi:hypothetical protein
VSSHRATRLGAWGASAGATSPFNATPGNPDLASASAMWASATSMRALRISSLELVLVAERPVEAFRSKKSTTCDGHHSKPVTTITAAPKRVAAY